jgi:putative ABC transport system substrate-binding protein
MMKIINKIHINIAMLVIGLTVLIFINEKPLLASSEKVIIAPDFTLENVDGENVSLKDFRGSIVVLGMVFEDKAAHDIEKYRERLNTEFKGKGINILKVVQVNKPIFITKKFVRSKIKKQFEYSQDAINYTLIDWGGALDLGTKYGIEDKDTPTIFIIGKNGEILFSFQGWWSEENMNILEKELSALLVPSSATQDKIFRIGVSRIMFHPALELAQNGFKTALEEDGYVEGLNLDFDYQDAQADFDKMTQIAHTFLNDKVDMIHSLSSSGTEEMVKVIKEIPVVFSMVTNPVEVGIIRSMVSSGTNVTGVSVYSCPLMDRWPVNSQLEMYVKFIPKAKRWGTIYKEGSVNTKFHITEMSERSELLGLELVEASVTKAEDVGKAAESLVGKVDAIFITSDTMAISAFEDIAKVCNENMIPLFGGELECVSKGAAAAYNQDYFLTGYKAGKKAIKILNGENPGDIPSEKTKQFYLVISPENAKIQGLAIPDELKKLADKIL